MTRIRDALGMTAAWLTYFAAVFFFTPIGWLVLICAASYWLLMRAAHG